MRVRLFTFRYSATLGGFDDEPLRRFTSDKEVISFREHFFCVNDVPHLACILVWQDAVVAREPKEPPSSVPASVRPMKGQEPRGPDRRPRRARAGDLQHAARVA